MSTMTEQLLLQSAWRIIHFSFRDEESHFEQALVPYILNDAVAIDVLFIDPQALVRFIVACSAERLTVDLEGHVNTRRFVLRPYTKSANPILDLMNDYEVWKQQQRR